MQIMHKARGCSHLVQPRATCLFNLYSQPELAHSSVVATKDSPEFPILTRLAWGDHRHSEGIVLPYIYITLEIIKIGALMEGNAT